MRSILSFQARAVVGNTLPPRRNECRRDVAQDHIVCGLGGPIAELTQARIEPREAELPAGDLLLQFMAPELEHAAQLLRRKRLAEQAGDLLQGEAKVLKRQDAIQLGKLIGSVIAIAGQRVGSGRLEQPHAIIVTQHPNGNAAEPGELADLEHGPSIDRDRVSESRGGAAAGTG